MRLATVLWVGLGILLLSCAEVSFGSVLVTGAVMDEESGVPLANVNIYVRDTHRGTITNLEGQFQIEVDEIPGTLIISHIGYETKTLEIGDSAYRDIKVVLTPNWIELQEAVFVQGPEDPAVGIMRKVIENKMAMKEKLNSYKASAYTRLSIENDSMIVSISESLSDVYWDRALGSREVFHETVTSAQMEYLTSLNIGSRNIRNFADDDIEIADYDFVSPTHPHALRYYDFRLMKNSMLDSTIVHEIRVTPKHDIQPLFEGVIYVLDEQFVVIEIDLKTNDQLPYNVMLKDFRGSYRQKFSDFGEDIWVPVDSRSRERYEIDMGVLAFPPATINTFSRISDYELNVDVAGQIALIDSLDINSQKDIKVVNNIQSLNQNNVIEKFRVPLLKDERCIFDHPDTTLTLINSFRPTGLLAGMVIDKEDEIEQAMRQEVSEVYLYESNSDFGFQAWYNRVEGLNTGISFEYNFPGRLNSRSLAGYESYSERVFYDQEFQYVLNEKQEDTYLFAGISEQTATRYQSSVYPQVFTSLLPLFGKPDYFDYYRRARVHAGLNLEKRDWASSFRFAINGENHSSLTAVSDFSLMKSGYTPRPNPAIDEGRLVSVSFSYHYDQYHDMPEIAKRSSALLQNSIVVSIESSPSQLPTNEFDFTRCEISWDRAHRTFFQRRPEPNYLRAKIELAGSFGVLPLQRQFMTDASIFAFTPFGVRKTLANVPLEGDRKVFLFWEYNFQSIPFEILGLDYFAENNYEFLLHGASGRIWLADRKQQKLAILDPSHYNDSTHHEIGAAIYFKYKFFGVNINVTRNLQSRSLYLGFTGKLLGLSL